MLIEMKKFAIALGLYVVAEASGNGRILQADEDSLQDQQEGDEIVVFVEDGDPSIYVEVEEDSDPAVFVEGEQD